MEQQQTVTLHKDEFNEDTQITFRELYDNIIEETETYRKLGKLEELMDAKVKINICDFRGNIVAGYANLFVGWLEDGEVLLTGNLRDIY